MNRIRRIVLLSSASVALLFAAAPAAWASTTPFSIYWTAPGDDGSVGRASSYDLRYSSLPITNANFALAVRITGLPLPGVAGTPETFVVSGLTDGLTVYLAIKSSDEVGNWSGISNLMARAGQATGLEPQAIALSFAAPWPNPARESVRFGYSAPTAVQVRIDVFDATGRHVHTVADEARDAGPGEFAWDLRDDRGGRVGAGVYFARAQVGATKWTKRLVVVR